MQIERVLLEPIGLGCTGEASQLQLRAMAWIHTRGSADGGGSLSAPWIGDTASQTLHKT